MKQEEFRSQPCFNLIKNIRERINQEDAKENLQPVDEAFLLNSLTFIENKLRLTDYTITDPKVLSNINSNLTSVQNELNSFLLSKNYGHINNIKNYIYQVLSGVNGLPILYEITPELLNNLVNDFRVKSETEYNHLQNEIKTLREEISAKENTINQITANIFDIQKQVNNLISQYTQTFEKKRQEYEHTIDSLSKDFNDQGIIKLRELTLKLEEASKLVNIIGNIGVTGDYQKNANYHQKQADIWRRIAIIFMVISVGYLAFTVFNITGYDWHISLLRILSTTLFIYPAQYAASQSSKHREQELLNRKMELDLAAINPFIEIFDESKKKEIKEKLIDRYFITNNFIQKNGDEIPIPIFEKIVELLKQVIDVVKK